MMRVEDLLQGRRQILQQMKPIGNLGRLWSPLANPCPIGFSAVTGHHRDVGMRLEPIGNGFSRPILQDIDGTAAFEIHDDRALALAFAPSPIIDANDFRLCPLGQYFGSPVNPDVPDVEPQRHLLMRARYGLER